MWEGSIRRSNPLLFNFIYHFWQKRCSFRISSTDQWYPVYRPSLERFIPLNCCKFTVFKLSKNHKTKKFSLDFARKSSISLCRVFYQRKNRFPYPFLYRRLEKGTPFEMYGRILPFYPIIGSIPFPDARKPESEWLRSFAFLWQFKHPIQVRNTPLGCQ